MYFFIRTDIKQGIHIESTLRNTEFQTKACRATTKSVMRSSLALQRAQKKEDRSNRKLFGGTGGAAGSSNTSPATGKKKYNVLSNSKHHPHIRCSERMSLTDIPSRPHFRTEKEEQEEQCGRRHRVRLIDAGASQPERPVCRQQAPAQQQQPARRRLRYNDRIAAAPEREFRVRSQRRHAATQ